MKTSKMLFGMLMVFVVLGTALGSDFSFDSTADWQSGTMVRTSVDNDSNLYLGWMANMSSAPSCFDTSTQTSTWSYSGGEANLVESLIYNAGIFVSDIPINISLPFIAESKVKMNNATTFTVYTYGIWQKAVQPFVTSSTLFNPGSRLGTFQDEFGMGYIYSNFRSPSDIAGYWNSTEWVGSYIQEYNGSMNTYYIYKYISNGTHIKQRLEDSSGALLTETSYLDWATSIKNDNNPYWLILGDGWNDTQYGNITVDYIKVSFNDGSWTSPTQTVIWERLTNLTINTSGLDSNVYINKVEILDGNNNVLDTYIGTITSSTTLTESDFNSGLENTNRNFKVKLYYTSDGSSIPAITSIEGNYEFTESYFIQEALGQIALLIVVGIIIFAVLMAVVQISPDLLYLLLGVLVSGMLLIIIQLLIKIGLM